MTPVEDLRRGGLTLAQVAGIEVALAEAHPPAAVFEQEGVDPETFTAAENAWRHELQRDGATQGRFADLIAIAEDCQKRAVPPFESDPRAWASLLAAGRRAGSLVAAATSIGLRRGDVSRLVRGWQARLVEDETVGEQLRALLARVGGPPAAQPEPATLRAYPWSPNGQKVAPPAHLPLHRLVFHIDGELPAERDPDVYASLVVTSERFPASLVRALELCGLLESDWNRLRAAWRDKLANDAEARAAFSARLADHRALAADPTLAKRP